MRADNGPINDESGQIMFKSGPINGESGQIMFKSGPISRESGPIMFGTAPIHEGNQLIIFKMEPVNLKTVQFTLLIHVFSSNVALYLGSTAIIAVTSM